MKGANWRLAAVLASLLAGWNWMALEAAPAGHSTVTTSIDTVLVAAPTGDATRIAPASWRPSRRSAPAARCSSRLGRT